MFESFPFHLLALIAADFYLADVHSTIQQSSVEWFNYQKDVMDSGALGAPGGDGGGGSFNPDAGDFKGF